MNDFFTKIFSLPLRKDSPSDNEGLPPEDPIRPVPNLVRPKIGLALSSGAAKGLAHIGVIQILEENNIQIDAVAGASMGAYVGALWAAGFEGKDLHKFAASIQSTWDALRLLDPVFPPRRGFVRGEKARARLTESLGNLQIEDLEKKLYVVATELEYLGRHVFDSGSVVDAVHASIAIPGICEPVTIDGVDYTDGGVSDPLPVGVLKRAGIDRVIAVSVMPSEEELRSRKRRKREKKTRGWKQWMNKHFNYWAEGNVFNIQRSAEFGMQMRLAELCTREADVRLRPVVCDAKWHDYAGYEKYIKVGRRTAKEKLAEIKALTEPILQIRDDS